MADTIHIAIPAVGAAYEFYARVTAESAQRHCSLPVEVHFISEEDFKRVLNSASATLNSDSFFDWHGSSITWSRLYLPELFPDLDWIISADADILFRGDVAELWKLRALTSIPETNSVWALPSRDRPMPGELFNRRAVEWYRENGLRFDKPEEYFCAGLTLFNLKAMREGDWAKLRDEFLSLRLSASTRLKPMPNADQCVLNYLLQDKKHLLPPEWGAFSGDENPGIDWSKSGAVHFVEDVPWCRTKITHLESDLVVEWKKLANELGGKYRWRNWRRAVFLLLKYNQWILRMSPKVGRHFRNTRGIRT